MKKKYFGITRTKGSGAVVGVVANGTLKGCRAATGAEVREILEVIRPAATPSLADALRDGTYPFPVVVWDKRADARAAVASLESSNSPHFNFSVGEFGITQRKVRRVLGWRIQFDARNYTFPSSHNTEDAGATIRMDGNLSNTESSNLLFPTRAIAREALGRTQYKRSREIPNGYYISAVYADE